MKKIAARLTTNIEKLAEELNAIIAKDERTLECTQALVSPLPGEKRIIMLCWLETILFNIKFDQVLPYDSSGARGSTNDVFAGAKISIDVNYGGGLHPTKASADKFCAHYLKLCAFALRDAAKAGMISSETLAQMKLRGPAPSDAIDAGTKRMIAIENRRMRARAKTKRRK